MFASVRIQNLRCLRDVHLELEPLTALVGPNASGKTTLLQAVQPSLAFNASYRWRRGPDAVERTFVRDSGKQLGVAEGRGHPVPTMTLDLRSEELRRSAKVQYIRKLGPRGNELPNVLASLGRRKLEEFSKQFCEWLPEYQDLDVRPESNGTHGVVLQDRWDPDLWLKTGEVSDGTMLMLAYLTLAYQPDTPELVTIEEPGRGLHPYLLSRVVALLRSLSEGLGDRAPVQVVVATHSPELLDVLRPDEVRFVERDSNTGETVVSRPPTEDDSWQPAFDAYRERLGEMWMSGGLGAVPGRAG